MPKFNIELIQGSKTTVAATYRFEDDFVVFSKKVDGNPVKVLSVPKARVVSIEIDE